MFSDLTFRKTDIWSAVIKDFFLTHTELNVHLKAYLLSLTVIAHNTNNKPL